MSKSADMKKGKWQPSPETVGKEAAESRTLAIIRDTKKPRRKIYGPRATFFRIYQENGWKKVLEALDIYNKKFGKVVYTEEQVKEWIKEENQKNVTETRGEKDEEAR